MQNKAKELKVNLWDVVMYLYLSFLVNNVYRSWVALVSSVFPNAITYFIFTNFPRRVIYLSWKKTWEWKTLELVLLSYCNLIFSNSRTPEGFNNMQFKSLTYKKL